MNNDSVGIYISKGKKHYDFRSHSEGSNSKLVEAKSNDMFINNMLLDDPYPNIGLANSMTEDFLHYYDYKNNNDMMPEISDTKVIIVSKNYPYYTKEMLDSMNLVDLENIDLNGFYYNDPNNIGQYQLDIELLDYYTKRYMDCLNKDYDRLDSVLTHVSQTLNLDHIDNPLSPYSNLKAALAILKTKSEKSLSTDLDTEAPNNNSTNSHSKDEDINDYNILLYAFNPNRIGTVEIEDPKLINILIKVFNQMHMTKPDNIDLIRDSSGKIVKFIFNELPDQSNNSNTNNK